LPFVPPLPRCPVCSPSFASTTGTTATRLPSVMVCAAGWETNPPGVPQRRHPRLPGSHAGSILK
jgi:hypothetical protein